MIPIQPFDPTQLAAGATGYIKTNGINKGEQLLLYNSSMVCLQLEFADKTQDVLPPCWARTWTKTSPMATIKYTTLFTLTLPGQPISQVYGTLYQPGEHIAEVNGPIQYVYVTGGGSVNVNNPSNVTNSGFAAGTIFISASVVNDPNGASEVLIKNSGEIDLGRNNAYNGLLVEYGINGWQTQVSGQGLIQFTNSITGFSDMVLYSESYSANAISEFQLRDTGGNVQFWAQGNGSLRINGTLSTIGNQNLTLNAPTGSGIELQVNANNIFEILSTGPVLQSGTISLLTGSISRIHSFTGSFAAAGTTTFAHGLGAIPDIVLLTLQGTSSGSSYTIKYDTTTLTSTNINIVATAALNFMCTVIKL